MACVCLPPDILSTLMLLIPSVRKDSSLSKYTKKKHKGELRNEADKGVLFSCEDLPECI